MMQNTDSMTMMQSIRLYYLESKFEWLKTIRNPAFALPAILFPVIFYSFFGVMLNTERPEAAIYLLCTYGVFGVIGPALFSFGVGLAVEKGQGWLDIKEASPMPAASQVVSRLVVSFIFSCIIWTSLVFIAIVFAAANLSVYQLALLSLIMLLGGLPFCLMGLFFGLTLKADSAPAIVNLIYLPLAFLSGLWMPIHLLPAFLHGVAEFLPPYHLAQLALKVVDLDANGAVMHHLLVMLIFSVLFFLLTIWAYNKKAI